MTILRNLLEQSRKRRTALEAIMRSSPEKTVIFTGAGMSTGKELYPGWGDLVARLAIKCGVPNFTEDSDYLDTADTAQRNDHVTYKQVILDYFGSFKPILQVSVSLLSDLKSRIYVTTNWDDSLALQLMSREVGVHILDDCKVENITTSGTHLFHPHGKINFGAAEFDIILTRSEFNKYYRINRKIYNFFYNLFLHHDVVFFGFSASDEYIREVLMDIKKHEKASGVKRNRFLFMHLPVRLPKRATQNYYLDLTKIEERENQFNELGIQLVWYDSSQDHKEVTDIVSSWILLQNKSQKDTSLGVNSGNV
ncbi:SIR2 family protein [Deinococcus roseus]|uniref:SIR2-like domain-containing protein n=1 Tax=Deinococcus roseus TaxID=392414 RepID=A0ABQ2D2X2_9DEIO|nr:SIR2 family protein [Deinococcus roseus]GGJ43929.1 hypothetical protein GCM10008938_32730 [Deinococcus roseus]